jgi:hypothetical protein
VTVEPLLPGERCKPGGLSDIAVIALYELEFHVESTQTDEADDVIKADGGTAGLPAGDSGLGRPGTVGELGLGKAGTPTGLPDKVTAVGTHTANIPDLLCSQPELGRTAEVADRRETATDVVVPERFAGPLAVLAASA